MSKKKKKAKSKPRKRLNDIDEKPEINIKKVNNFGKTKGDNFTKTLFE